MDLSDPKRPVFDFSKISREHAALIQDVSFHPRTGKPIVKFCDKVSAYAHLGRFEGLSKERLEQTGPSGEPMRVEITFVEPKRQ